MRTAEGAALPLFYYVRQPYLEVKEKEWRQGAGVATWELF